MRTLIRVRQAALLNREFQLYQTKTPSRPHISNALCLTRDLASSRVSSPCQLAQVQSLCDSLLSEAVTAISWIPMEKGSELSMFLARVHGFAEA
jgi:hypothetical protein